MSQLALFDPPFEHLTIDPTPAMRRGEQTVWQCSWCGAIVVTDSGQPGLCPSARCGRHPKRAPTSWWEQRLPVAGIREADSVDRALLVTWLDGRARVCDELAESCERYAAANGGGAHGGPGFRLEASIWRGISRRLRSLSLSESSEPS